jgi:hypothetical protein
MRRHPFDPISFVLGLFVISLGALFLFGDRSAAEIGARWLWPFPVAVAGLVAVLAALRMVGPQGRPDQPEAETAEPEHDDEA